MKFIHVTDPHIVAPGKTLFGLDPRDRMEKCVASINAHHADADFCIWTGDLVHWGDREAYHVFREVLSDLTVPSHLVMGNHDGREALLEVFPDTPVDANGFVQYALDLPLGRFLILDTVQDGTHHGELCDARLGWLDARLDEADRRNAYIFMHHPPMRVGMSGMDSPRLVGVEQFVEVVTGRGNVRHIFCGHLHRPIHGCWRGIPFSTLRATSHAFKLSLKPTTGLVMTHENPGYAIVLLKDGATVIHDHSYLEEGPEFEYKKERKKEAAD